jgi:hypothetical protein
MVFKTRGSNELDQLEKEWNQSTDGVEGLSSGAGQHLEIKGRLKSEQS